VVDGQYKLKPGATIIEPPPAAKNADGKDGKKAASGSSN
jgi:multidrug efflux system membrane fusion protein